MLHSHTSQEADFEQCSCIADRLSSSSANSSYTAVLAANSTATDGLCDRNCGVKLGFFLLLIGVGLFCVFMLQIPNVLVTIRSVGVVSGCGLSLQLHLYVL